MHRGIAVAVALAGLGAVSTVASAERVPGADHGGLPLHAVMTGAQEAPGPGDPDGSGTATITLNHGQREVCWSLNAADIELPARAAHIHRAPAGEPGPVVVGLSAPDASGASSGCAEASRALIDELRDDPQAFYVNVHTASYPGGAIRGQLGR